MGPWFRKQNQTWYVQIGGRQINLGKDKNAAFREYHRLMGKVGDGVPLKDHSVREILDDYWTWLRANRSPETCKARRPILKSFGQSIPPKLQVRQLQPVHVQRWIDRNFATNGPTRRNVLITTIKAAIAWAVKMGYAETNPIAAMEKPSPNIRQEFVPVDQWPKLLQASKDDLRDFLIVILDSGARVQEMFKYEAAHFVGSRLVLPIVDSKGKKQSRVVNLPVASLAIVKRLVAEYPEGKLFRTSEGIPWNRNTLRCRFRKLKQIMGMPKLCATTLRHSFAHNRLTNKQDSLTVVKLMGHKDTRMIATRYGHLEDSEYLAGEANRISFPSIEIQTGGPGTVEGLPA
jgi:integrase